MKGMEWWTLQSGSCHRTVGRWVEKCAHQIPERNPVGAGEVAQWVREFAAQAWDLSSDPSTDSFLKILTAPYIPVAPMLQADC